MRAEKRIVKESGSDSNFPGFPPRRADLTRFTWKARMRAGPAEMKRKVEGDATQWLRLAQELDIKPLD